MLEGLNRVNVDGTAAPSGQSITVSFATSIPEGSLLRLEVTDMQFPGEGGDYQVTGSYHHDGASHEPWPLRPSRSSPTRRLQSIVNWLDNQAWVEAWNPNQFLGMFFKPQLLVTSFVAVPRLVPVLGIVIAAYPFCHRARPALLAARISKHRLLRAIAVVYHQHPARTRSSCRSTSCSSGLPMVGINIDK